MEGGGNRAGGFDSRPTVDMHDIEHESPQLQMEQMFLRVQRKLFGDAYRRTMAHYAVVRPIGQGAMGMVYEAIDQRLSREVALKLVLPEVVQSARGKSRLLREARAMAKISHPNVVAVYDVGETGGVVYIAMEFVRGATLRRWLASAPRSLAEILDVFIQAGAGLAAAHHADIVHRDFKPDNVLVGHDGRARVLDFGLAFPRIAELTSDEVTAPHATAAGFDATRDGAEPPRTNEPTDVSASNMLAGTIAYMSPEQLLARPLDGRSDQFSFCVSLYEGLYGQRPFTGRSFHEFVDHVQRGELAPVANPPRLPGWLTAVLPRLVAARAVAGVERGTRAAARPAGVHARRAGRVVARRRADPGAPDRRSSALAGDRAARSERAAAPGRVRDLLRAAARLGCAARAAAAAAGRCGSRR
ncbi:MAG: serine/threonine protein kinase [Deltaproteobacteria bacterium]|nr:MAG: serine/threonine protein kinase [Deltaproteobacteria bacterium]